jgi:hypothetical protein
VDSDDKNTILREWCQTNDLPRLAGTPELPRIADNTSGDWPRLSKSERTNKILSRALLIAKADRGVSFPLQA